MLVIGLGNPGSEYQNTRHNAGFLALDYLASSHNCTWQKSTKFDAEITNFIHDGKKIHLLKPMTYMNLSGKSAQLVKSYYKLDISDIIVIYDELDLALGSLKHKIGGGSAGHNGIKSIDSTIGKDYNRIRIGIGRPDNGMDPSDYVLGKFSKDERMNLDEIIYNIDRHFDLLSKSEYTEFQSKFK